MSALVSHFCWDWQLIALELTGHQQAHFIEESIEIQHGQRLKLKSLTSCDSSQVALHAVDYQRHGDQRNRLPMGLVPVRACDG